MRSFLPVVALSFLFVPSTLAAEPEAAPEGVTALVGLIGQVDDASFQVDLLKGMHEALQGRRNVKMPAGWSEVGQKLAQSSNEEVRRLTRVLSVIFGDPQALKALRRTMLAPQAAVDERTEALQALVEKKAEGLAAELQKLVADPGMARAAIRGLAAFDHEQTPAVLLSHYQELSPDAKRDVINTLSSRPKYALALLAGIEAKQIERDDVSAFTARQLQSFEHPEVNQRLEQVWGVIRQTSADKAEQMDKFKQLLTADYLKKADLSHGRLLFQKTCLQCHKLYGKGGAVGPELTGSNRNNLDYVLSNVLDPSAIVAKDYQLTLIITLDGRVVAGLVQSKSAGKIVVRTVNETVIVPEEDVDEMQIVPKSMMPDNLLAQLKPEQVRDLVGYLASPMQVPLPPGVEEAQIGTEN